ncbi:MAG: trypsin-like serine peptidase [Candidatus Nitrospinota bacterium M3_3B_026]
MITATMHGKRSVFLFVLLAGILVGLGEHGGFAFADELEFTPSQRQDFSDEALRRQFPPKKVEPYPLEIESARTLPDENKIILPPLTAKEIEIIRNWRSVDKRRPAMGGIGRDVEEPIRDKWKFIVRKKARGVEINVWQMAIVSPGAIDISVNFSNMRLPEGAFLYTYGLEAKQPDRFQTSKTGREWSLTGVGDTIVLEYHVPVEYPGPSELEPCSIENIMHGYGHDYDHSGKQQSRTKAVCFSNNTSDCYEDICNHLSEYDRISRAVARLKIKGIYDSQLGYSYCTGTLIGNKSGDFTPFFLTAYHCLEDEDSVRNAPDEEARFKALNNVAKNIEFKWHHNSSCGTPSTSIGAKYLAGKGVYDSHFPKNTDYAFFMLLGAALPDDNNEVIFAGTLRAETLEDDTDVVSIHHPGSPEDAKGDHKRISFGSKKSNLEFDNDEDGKVDETYPDYKKYYTIQWYSSSTEPGSSGSPLIPAMYPNLITGHLHGGFASCDHFVCDKTYDKDRPDHYGNFFYTYNDINKSLNPVTVGNLIVGGADDEFDKGAGNDDEYVRKNVIIYRVTHWL